MKVCCGVGPVEHLADGDAAVLGDGRVVARRPDQHEQPRGRSARAPRPRTISGARRATGASTIPVARQRLPGAASSGPGPLGDERAEIRHGDQSSEVGRRAPVPSRDPCAGRVTLRGERPPDAAAAHEHLTAAPRTPRRGRRPPHRGPGHPGLGRSGAVGEVVAVQQVGTRPRRSGTRAARPGGR